MHRRLKSKDSYHKNFFYAMRDSSVHFIPQGLFKNDDTNTVSFNVL